MAPTILIVGATGNTGRSAVETLPNLLKQSKNLSDHRILALTRNLNSPVAQQLAQIPGVDVEEQDWVEITQAWLREHNVERVFIAPHTQPNQFAVEGQFHVNALKAGVKYVVRISTTAQNVYPDNLAYYTRSHWAIETLLSQPEFSNMQWTSLQPNGFLSMFLWPVAEYIKQYRKTGEKGTLGLLLDANSPVGLIDSDEVGIIAAHLLAQDDTNQHNHAKYCINGPENTNGDQIVGLAEQLVGTKIENIVYKDLSMVDQMAERSRESKNVILSIKHAITAIYEGKCTASTTSKEIFELYKPKRTASDVLKNLVAEE